MIPTKVLFRMKIRIFFILIITLMVSASAYAQHINLSVNKATLKQVFKELKAQSGYNFFYSEIDLKNAKLVTVNITSGNLEEVLEKIFEGQPLTYTISGKTVVVKDRPSGWIEKLKTIFKSLMGVVTDEKGKPLPSVTVTIEGSEIQTATDIYGRFNLQNLARDAVLKISCVGYQTKLIHVSTLTDEELSIQLKASINELEEVVMVGYGSTQRKDLTGSISSVNMDNLKNTTYTSIDQALSGQASGVQVVQGDGSPGGLAKIRIRGGTSLVGGNDPLYVVDGVQLTIENRYIQAAADLVNPVENLTSDPSAATTIGSSFTRGLNILAGLNINDIESIDILKDASATAIYGSKAANGVVIIMTKKGLRNQKPTVEANYAQTYSTPRTLKVLNAGQYEAILKEGAANLNKQLAPYYSDVYADSILNVPTYFRNNTNWIDLVTRTGISQNANVSIRGGGPDSRYYTSLSYDNQTGTVLGTDFSRIAGKVNLDNDITDRIRLNTNLDYGFTKNDITNGVYTSAVLAPPNLVPFNPDGSPKQFNPEVLGGSVAEGAQNPFSLLQGENHANTALLLGSLSLEYTILNSLKFKSTFSLNYTNYHQQNYVPDEVYIATSDPHSTGGVSTQGQTQETDIFYENTLTWNKQFNSNNRLNLLGGTSWQRAKTNTFSASSDGFPSSDVLTSLSAASATLPSAQLNDQSALLSFYIRANYALKDRYLLTITGRSDASSKFPANNRVGYFPSAGLAWLLNKESFLKNISWLNELKLRVSTGLTGTQNLSDNLFYTFFTPASYAGNKALIASKLGSDQTKWETTSQKDAGIDFALFNSRLRGSFGYYDKKSSDLLVALPLPTSTGFSNALQNYAAIDNRGLEIELRGDIIQNKTFQWNAALNISGNRSKVLKLSQALSDPFAGPVSANEQLNSLYLGSTILTVGQPVGLIYGTKYLGVVKTAAKNSYNSYQQLGSPIYQLVGAGPEAGFPEHMVIGHAEPKYFGGITNTFTYKRFSLTSLFTFSYGGELIFLPRQNDVGMADQSNHTVAILDHYSATNPASNNPGLILKESGNTPGISSFDVFNASYLKLKSLTIDYQLPQKFTDKLHIHQANIFLAGNNLLIVSKYPGPDPEVSNNPYSLIGGYTDDASYPTSRQYSFGLRLGL